MVKHKKRVKAKKAARKIAHKHAKKYAQKFAGKDLAEFCKKCGSIMIPVKKGSTLYMQCRSCHYKTSRAVKEMRIRENVEKEKKIVVLEKDETMLPLTDKICPQCEHKKAYWWMQQTRNSDEPPTQFFRCFKCHHVWREYK